ncbi:MAG: 2-polyprenylphenol 6-hydroxylase [Alphaproteobacteria bacterium]|nr:2-polyprenylphenol 6-hydroxylase [Alphaproteobacteria bacterium]
MLRTLRNTRRLLHAARVLAQHDALVPREYLAGMPFSVRVMRRILGTRDATDTEALSAGIRLARALESLGPAYIKLGQVLATRPDLIGDDVALALESLQDRLPPFPTDVAKAQVELALRKPVTEMFEAFGDAVAAASIAQVHEARTTGEGRRVAVKILRPGVEQQFAEDLSAFAFAAGVAERFSAEARRLRVVTVIDRLTTSVALELDLRMEAAAASELRENTRADEDFRVPEVDWDRTGERVMTAEWIDGITVRDPAAIAAAGHDPRRLAIVVIRTFLTHALRDGFFHADMHQGNLFVDVEGRLVAVDFGIMGRLSPEMRRFLAETLNGFLNRDYLRVAQVHYDFGFVPRTHPIATFAQALRAIGEPIFGRTARDMSMGRLLQQLFDTTRRFDMAVQPQLLLMQKTMMVAEGVARTLDPEFDIWAASRPVVERWMVQSVGPEARLRDAAEGLEALSRAAQHLPRLVRDAEAVSQMLAEGGLRLHPDTMRHFADVQIRRAKHIRVAIWIAAAALAVLAFVLVLRP